MKIAITAEESNMESKIDQRFGRCRYFLVFDIEYPDGLEVVENQGAIQGHGAGIRAGQQMGELEVEAVITGSLGPNAAEILSKLGIRSYHAAGKAKDAVEDLKNSKLKEIDEISEPHSGLFSEKEDASEKRPNADKENKERIFFPLLEDNGRDSRISDHFGHAPFFGVYDVSENKLDIIPNDLDHTDPSKSPIDQIEEAVNPTIIFAKGIGGRAISIIEEKGLKLKTGDFNTAGEAIDNLENLEEQKESCGH